MLAEFQGTSWKIAKFSWHFAKCKFVTCRQKFADILRNTFLKFAKQFNLSLQRCKRVQILQIWKNTSKWILQKSVSIQPRTGPDKFAPGLGLAIPALRSFCPCRSNWTCRRLSSTEILSEPLPPMRLAVSTQLCSTAVLSLAIGATV